VAAELRLGLGANLGQFSLLVAVNGLVGAMVGLERSVLPLVGRSDFDVASKAAILAFVVAFGAAKALTNLLAGAVVERFGRKQLLIAGWLLALPVAPMVALAPSWAWVVAANVFLGASQGLAWSMTVLMKIDLVGPERRGLALGLNESVGYGGVAGAALATGLAATAFAPRSVVWVSAASIAVLGTAASAAFVRETSAHAVLEQTHYRGRPRRSVLRACSQAGLVNNLNDAVAWGLVPLYLAAHGAGRAAIGAVAALYPAVWGLGQIPAGWLSDHVGRREPIVVGMLVQGAALGLLAAGGGAVGPSLGAAALLGVGTALVYPTLLAAVSDELSPQERGRGVGIYRFWRDAGFVAGALVAGLGADAIGIGPTIGLVAALTAGSGLVVVAGYGARSAAAMPPIGSSS
jgi:MFS family permease